MTRTSICYDAGTHPMEMDWTSRGRIPSFGLWNFYDEIPVTQYFDSARQAGLHRHHYFVDDVSLDHLRVAPSPLPYHYQKPKRTRNAETRNVRSHHDRWDSKKQGRVYDENHQEQKHLEKEVEQQQKKQRRLRTPKAVDEDLYKIPPEMLYQKPKSGTVLSGFWKRCLRLSCIP